MKTAAEVRHQVCAHDLVFDFIPESYFEGLPMGNGELRAMLWFENDRLVLSLDHADIWEHRADQSLEEGMDYATALKQERDRSFAPTCRLFNPKRPQDMAATIYEALGIPQNAQYPDIHARPHFV